MQTPPNNTISSLRSNNMSENSTRNTDQSSHLHATKSNGHAEIAAEHPKSTSVVQSNRPQATKTNHVTAGLQNLNLSPQSGSLGENTVKNPEDQIENKSTTLTPTSSDEKKQEAGENEQGHPQKVDKEESQMGTNVTTNRAVSHPHSLRRGSGQRRPNAAQRGSVWDRRTSGHRDQGSGDRSGSRPNTEPQGRPTTERGETTKHTDDSTRKPHNTSRDQRQEEQLRRQSEELQIMSNQLRLAQDQHKQTLDLLELRTRELKSAQTFLSKEDSLSGAEVIGMIESLNAEIMQVAAFMADSLSSFCYSQRSNINLHHGTRTQGHVSLGKSILGALQSKREKIMMVQLASQVSLANVCSMIIESWFPGYWGCDVLLTNIYTHIKKTEEQSVSSRWRSMTCSQIKQFWDHQTQLMTFIYDEIADVLGYAGYPWQLVRHNFLYKFEERFSTIVRLALRIHEAIHISVVSGDLQTIIFAGGESFDPIVMDGPSPENRGSDKKLATQRWHGVAIVGTSDIGLQRSVKGSLPIVLKKPKVILPSMLESIV